MIKPITWCAAVLALVTAPPANGEPVPPSKCQPDTLGALRSELANSLRERNGNGSAKELQNALEAPGYTLDLIRHQLLQSCWDEATRLAATSDGPEFLAVLLNDQPWMEKLFTSGPISGPGRSLRYLGVIGSREPSELENPLYKRLATALALQKAEGDHRSEANDYHLYRRFLAYLNAHRQLRLHASFDKLETWEMRLALETGGDDAHFDFLLNDRHYRTGDYYGACWAVAYRLHNQFGDSIHGPLYYRPWSHVYERPEYMRKVGGVCGSLSTFGTMTARAHGLPAMTAGQPGHCAFCVRDRNGRWRSSYNVAFPTTPHTQWWYRGTFPVLFLMEAVHADPAKVLAARRHAWQSQLYQSQVSILQPIECSAALGKRDALDESAPVLSGTIDSLDVRRFAPRPDHYALRFTGKLDASQDGEYRIHLSADDAASLKIDGEMAAPAKGNESIVKLLAGSHSFQLDFEEHGGRESLGLQFEPVASHPVALNALRLATQSHPLHLGLWNKQAEVMRRSETTADQWKQLGLGVAKIFHDHQEAAWAFIHKYPAAELAKTTEPRELLGFLGSCHKVLIENNASDFIRYPYDRVLNHQANLLKKDPSAVFDLFRGTLATQAGSTHSFPVVLAFGKRFDANPDFGPRYRTELARLLEGGDEQNAASMPKVIATNIQEAEKRGDREGFQSYAALADLTGKPNDPGYLHCKPKQLENFPKPKAFPGDVLSAGGLLQPSSSDGRYDRPLAHPNVLRKVPHGGYFQTAAQEKPHVIVKLEGPGELTGISIVNRYELRSARQVPLVVSISEDGKAWSEVFRTEEVQPAWEIDLGEEKPKAAWVKIARDGDKKECFNLRSIRVWGKKLY